MTKLTWKMESHSREENKEIQEKPFASSIDPLFSYFIGKYPLQGEVSLHQLWLPPSAKSSLHKFWLPIIPPQPLLYWLLIYLHAYSYFFCIITKMLNHSYFNLVVILPTTFHSPKLFHDSVYFVLHPHPFLCVNWLPFFSLAKCLSNGSW